MKNMFKMNKKGFTLVELLAVIVILALLIVITANTILPMLTKTKGSGMTTYAEKVLSNAQTTVEADKLTGELEESGVKIYTISGDLTKTNSYFGCVKYYISDDTTTADVDEAGKYEIKMYSLKDELYLTSTDLLSVTDTTDTSKFDTDTYTGAQTDGTAFENACEDDYADLDAEY